MCVIDMQRGRQWATLGETLIGWDGVFCSPSSFVCVLNEKKMCFRRKKKNKNMFVSSNERVPLTPPQKKECDRHTLGSPVGGNG